MEVTIRLQKAGKPAQKHFNYRIVAIPKNKSRDSKYLELLGYYDPSKKPASIELNQEKLDSWIKKGARLSDTVKSLMLKLKRAAK
ncbi:MAG: 30S ribosomal protein S16 [Candidatus Omnitrophica bacterium]|nr:30S ribosomal protein S16 [Candidatus Omnitrophota bacterium]